MNYLSIEKYGHWGFMGAGGEFHLLDNHGDSIVNGGQVVYVPGVTWDALERAEQRLLAAIAETGDMTRLIREHGFTYAQYRFLSIAGLITWREGQDVKLTDEARGMLHRNTVAPAASEMGDQVTITGLYPRLGRTGYVWGNWYGKTDDANYTVTLYPEDFRALEKAGYKMPDWNDRPTDNSRDELEEITFGKRSGFAEKGRKGRKAGKAAPATIACNIEVILSAERSDHGWRIAKVIPSGAVQSESLTSILVNYRQIRAGDVIEDGYDTFEIMAIRDSGVGKRTATVKDSDGQREMTLSTASGMFSLRKGELLDKSRQNRSLLVWAGMGWRYEGSAA